LMIHGDCSSRGCYAMTDEQIGEIYALARESFFGGQKAFQVEAFPFRMTATNMAKHRNSPHMAFWRMLKEGYDHFEVTRIEPKVDVCERKYVFDAAASADSSKPKFSAAGKCPVYEVPAEIAAAVAEKQQSDEKQFAELSNSGTPTAPIVTGRDGGMNPVFVAAATPSETGTADPMLRAMAPVTPGTVPANVVPPGTSDTSGVASAKPATQLASAGPGRPVEASTGGNLFGGLFSSKGDGPSKDTNAQSKKSDGILDSMSRLVGLRGSEPDPTPAPGTPMPKTKPTFSTASVVGASRAKPDPSETAPRPTGTIPVATTQGAIQAPANAGAIAPRAKPQPLPENAQTASAAPANGQISGSQPVLPGSTFDSRWGGFR
jgi:hypothetical protein